MAKTFRSYLMELEKNPMTTSRAAEKWLGIDPTLMQDMPQFAAQVDLGKYSYNGLMLKVLRVVRDRAGQVTAALIQPLNDPTETAKGAYVKGVEMPRNDMQAAPMWVSGKSYEKIIATPVNPGQSPGLGAPF